MEIGEKIKKLRTEKKLSQKELALKIGVTQQNVAYFEKKGNTITLENIFKIATALEIQTKSLLFDDIDYTDVPNSKEVDSLLAAKDKENEELRKEIEYLRKESEINKKLLKDAISHNLQMALNTAIEVIIRNLGGGSIDLPNRSIVEQIIIDKYEITQYDAEFIESAILQYYCEAFIKRIKVAPSYAKNELVFGYMFDSIEQTYDLEYLFNNGFVNDKSMTKIYGEYKKKQKEENEAFRRNPQEPLEFEMGMLPKPRKNA